MKPRKNLDNSKILSDHPKKHENPNLLKMSVTKLAKLKNPKTKLCKAVLINNAFKRLQKQSQFGFHDFAWRTGWNSKEQDEEKNEKESEDSSENIEQNTNYQMISVSPYSYNSFLSEVYKAVDRNIRRKISD